MSGLAVSRRRALVGGFAAVASGLAGWWVLGRDDADPLDGPPDGIEETTFDWSRDNSEMAEENVLPGDEPRVRFHGSTRTVSITGVLTYGSSSCDAIRVEDLSLDEASDELRVDVGWEEDGSDDGLVRVCNDDLDDGSYELRLRFAEELPTAVRVVEHHRAPSEDDGERVVSTTSRREGRATAVAFGPTGR